jgi:hypothetical protein
LLAHELLPLGVVNAMPIGKTSVHTLMNPRLGYLAARAAFAGSEGVPLPSAAAMTATIGQRNSLQHLYAERFGGRLPEEERGRLVAQLCLHRPRECQTQLAAWTRDVPDSPVRSLVTSSLVGKSGGKIDVSLAPSLLPLLGVGPADAGPVSVADAQRATELFVSYYTPAAPFSREALADIWRRCEADPAQRDACRAARVEADLQLGSSDVAPGPAAPS